MSAVIASCGVLLALVLEKGGMADAIPEPRIGRPRQLRPFRKGTVVLATLDGDTTVKRPQRRGRRVTLGGLVAEKPSYWPIEVRTEASVIQGVVVGFCEHSMSAPEAIEGRRGAVGSVGCQRRPDGASSPPWLRG